jgi:hypothetical protein
MLPQVMLRRGEAVLGLNIHCCAAYLTSKLSTKTSECEDVDCIPTKLIKIFNPFMVIVVNSGLFLYSEFFNQ